MRKNHHLLLSKGVFFIFLYIIAQPLIANDSADLIKLLNQIHTMQASFEQSLLNQRGLNIGEKTTGEIIIERPGKFRWETRSPSYQLIIINQNRSLLYDAELSQLVRRNIDPQNPSNPAMLLSSSPIALTNSFRIIKLKNHGSSLWFELKPKTRSDQESEYQWIKMQFINKQLKSMVIANSLEQKTMITFSRMRLNSKISPKMFRFTPRRNTETLNVE